MSVKSRLFLILFLAAEVGVLSILLIDLQAVVSLVPVRNVNPTITPFIKVVSLIQPTLLVALAVFLGVKLAAKVGLSAPVAEALAANRDAMTTLKPQVVPGVVGGIVGGVAIVLTAAIFNQFLLPETIEFISEFGRLVPLPTRLLYGGITEEVLLRWGFLTLLVWLGWRLLQKGTTLPANAIVVSAIFLSALVFGLGHLPIAFMLLTNPGLAVILFVIIANSAFGIVAGFLYWKKGLESAMIAHMLCHLVLFMASYAGAYY